MIKHQDYKYYWLKSNDSTEHANLSTNQFRVAIDCVTLLSLYASLAAGGSALKS